MIRSRAARFPVWWLSWMMVTAILATSGGPWAAAAQPEEEAAAIQHAKTLSTAFRAAAKKVVPTVVEIRTESNARSDGRSGMVNPFRGTPWEDLFEDQMPGFRFRMIPEQPLPGLGSGVIIDPSGVVLTNNHVVKDADKVVVHLSDGRKYEAVEIKTDEKTDLAVVRIKPSGPLPAAKLGDSDELEIGDWVIAVGNPFELQQTVSAGIISAKGRSLGTIDSRSDFLQTDAAINPGNSGGPLVNLEGEVVGINTAIYSRNGAYQGIGFAIPVNTARWVTPQLIEQGTVKRAYLGVTIGEVTAEVAEELSVQPLQGVVVGAVSRGSPAEKAGLREDDVILSYDRQPLRTPNDLQRVVERSSADSRHRLEVIRDGRRMTVDVEVESMPGDFGVASFLEEDDFGQLQPSGIYQSSSLGLAVVDLSPAMAEQLGLDTSAGVLLVSVPRQGAAYRAGLREGMVIMKVGEKPAKNVRDFRAALAEESLERGITLEVRTKQGSETVTIRGS